MKLERGSDNLAGEMDAKVDALAAEGKAALGVELEERELCCGIRKGLSRLSSGIAYGQISWM